MRDLCYVQWDPIDAVAPSHIVSLWSRLGNFPVSDLDDLLWKEKKLFLHWTPIASIVRTQDYPLFHSLMRRYPESLTKSWGGQREIARAFLAKHADLRKRIVTELRKKGPLQVSQFQDHDRSARSADGWTPGSTVTRMLHYMMMSGEVMVVGHQGFLNVWGLSETFLPDWVDKRNLTAEEFELGASERALLALGIAFPREIHLYFPRGRYHDPKKALEDLRAEGRIHRIHVEGLAGRNERYIHSDDVKLLESLDSDSWVSRATLLAPFDNILTDRGRLKRVFEFDYMHEQFVPENKRKYGTWVYPILYGEKIVGRADLRMDKANGKLVVNSVHSEPKAPTEEEVADDIARAIGGLASFLGAKGAEYTARVPRAWRRSLR